MSGLGPKLTVVTQTYWPEHVGIAPYSTRLAEHFAERGAEVNVVTAMPHYPSWRIDSPRYRRLRVREERNAVVINRFWHYVPTRQTAIRRAAYEATFFLHAGLSKSSSCDAVIGVIPSLSAGAIARTYAGRNRCPYGIIVQDLLAEAARQSGITKLDTIATATGALERWVLSSASRVAVVTERFVPHVVDAGVDPDRIGILRNWVEIDASGPTTGAGLEPAALRRSLGWADGEQVVLHAGNMGVKQGLEFVVLAAREAAARKLPIRFVLMGDGSQRPMIERESTGLSNVQLMPILPRDKCNEIMAVADVLLVNERRTMVDMALPSKLTSYFAAGRPVVAAVTDEGTTAQELRRAGAGLVVPPENPDALVDAVMRLAGNRRLAADLGARGADYARRELSAGPALEQADAFVRMVMEGA